MKESIKIGKLITAIGTTIFMIVAMICGIGGV